ncbi:MAG: type II toxin-antitoxin system Phd/YefM family antitoxin [Desulfobacteraceae bacterium]|nr:MAG: type II toxin-antitoxin system Phd/YefM family antitoxin [Desulfobacteraceae bacterium]
MKIISLSEFKKNTRQVIHLIKKGQRIILTYRGKAVCRLEPLNNKKAVKNDLFYKINRLADTTAGDLSDDEIDRILYCKNQI